MARWRKFRIPKSPRKPAVEKVVRPKPLLRRRIDWILQAIFIITLPVMWYIWITHAETKFLWIVGTIAALSGLLQSYLKLRDAAEPKMEPEHRAARRKTAIRAVSRTLPTNLRPVLEQLKHDDPQERRAAVGMLDGLGNDDPVPLLLVALNDAHEQVRAAAAGALAHHPDPKAIEPLAEALLDSSGLVRSGAESALAAAGSPAVPFLIEIAKLQKGDYRERAIRTLAAIGDPACIPVLLDMLKNKESENIADTIEALGQFHTKEVYETLVEMLDVQSSAVQQATVSALARQNYPGVADVLIGILERRGGSGGEAAAAALGELRYVPAVPALVGCLHNYGYSLPAAAATALGKIGAPEAVPALAELIPAASIAGKAPPPPKPTPGDMLSYYIAMSDHREIHPETRRAAIEALAVIGTPEAMAVLVKAQRDPDNEAARIATQALLSRAADMHDVLIDSLRDADPQRRAAAASVLGEVGPAAVEPLIAALSDPDAAVRWMAVLGLELYEDRGIAPALLPLLADADPAIREIAARRLGRLCFAPALDGLAALLRDPHRATRLAAVEALTALGEPSIAALSGALHGEHPDVALAAAGALDHIGTPEALASLDQAWTA